MNYDSVPPSANRSKSTGNILPEGVKRPSEVGFGGWLGGVVLPTLALVLELVGGFLGGMNSDPIPTWFHVVLITLVPLVNGSLMVRWRQTQSRLGRSEVKVFGWALPVVMGIAAFYSVVFIPMLGVGFVAILFFGLGLLVWSPVIALVTSMRLFGRLRRCSPVGLVGGKQMVVGLLLGAALPNLPSVPVYLLHRAIAGMADTGTTNGVSVGFIRDWVPQRMLILAGEGTWPNWSQRRRDGIDRNLEQDFAAAWYRLYEESFDRNAALRRGRIPFLGPIDRGGWDAQQGGREIGAVVAELSLIKSEMEVVTYGLEGVGYAEWTMEFRNDSKWQEAEARALLALPAGGVVSRLTLWIEGEPHEAAFGGKSQTTQAYQQVVARRQDPVLVTWKGPDQVMMQCFPVLRNGGLMQIRVGVSFPLERQNEAWGAAALPSLSRQNFTWRKDLETQVTVVGGGALAESLTTVGNERAGFRPDTTGYLNVVSLGEESTVGVLSIDGRSAVLEQRWELVSDVVGSMRLVVDGSGALAEWQPRLAEMLRQRKNRGKMEVFFAGDTVERSGLVSGEQAAMWLEKRKFVGGQDCAVALREALGVHLKSGEGGSVVWFRGSQGWVRRELVGLRELVREIDPAKFHLVDLDAGRNALDEKLTANQYLGLGQRHRATSGGDAGSLLKRIGAPHWRVVRRMRPLEATEPLVDGAGAKHLARVWAAAEIGRLMTRDDRVSRQARDWAVRMQLVTPVSGAVVLERVSQYEEAGLKPIDPASAPSVPEPGSYGLWMMLIIMFFMFMRRPGARRSQRAAA